jgi:hypothetical protein
MKNKIAAVLFLIVSILLLTACGSEESEVLQEQQGEQESVEEKVVQPNFQRRFNHVLVGINEIVIRPEEIRVKIGYQNVSTMPISWFPNQGSIVAGDRLLKEDFNSRSGLLIGTDIEPDAVSNGELVFKTFEGEKLDVNSIQSVRFYLNNTTTSDYSESEDINFHISIK